MRWQKKLRGLFVVKIHKNIPVDELKAKNLILMIRSTSPVLGEQSHVAVESDALQLCRHHQPDSGLFLSVC